MGFFDTLLTAIAPERAVKRVAAQTAIRAINSGYSNYGASLHKKSMRGWMWHGGSPKEDIEDNLRVLRERSRDAYMGVPLATGAIKTMRTNVVCGGLTPTPQIDNAFLGISDEEAQKINEQIAREFALWANKPTCDADRIDNFYMLQQLAFTGFLLNGDSWAVLQNKKTPGVPYDLRVRIIEADRICSPAFMDILSPTDINEHHVEKIVQGVETDADGMVIAYWVCDRHPLASTSVTGLTASHWTRVEAYGKKTGRQNVLCLMQRERAGQLRGVPLLAPVLESLKQLGRFTDAELTSDHTYTASKKWNENGGDFWGDVKAMCRMLSARGLPAKDLILGTDVADYILTDERTRQLLDKNSGIIVGEIRQQLTQYDGVVFMGTLNFGGFMLNVFSVDETYEDETGKSARYFPATAAMVTAPDCGHMMYGSITQMDYGKTDYTTYAAKRVAKLVVDQDKDTRKLRLGCRPLAAPKTYCPYIYAADVVG